MKSFCRLRFPLVLLVALSAGLARLSADTLPARPKLVVGIVVDQMRWDYLYRFQDRYEEGGFRRMLGEGFSCENTLINYIPTVTAIGHASIYTGSVPAIHGIAGNNFILRATGLDGYCVDDAAVSLVGTGDQRAGGGMSPRNLLTTTVTDELKLATNFRAKVIGIALKDRGSILPVGHSADAAYWYDSTTGRWITSTYYRPELPEWAERFNRSGLIAKLANDTWAPLYPIETYVQSLPDDNPYEQALVDGMANTFPLDFNAMGKHMKEPFDILRDTPQGNTATLAFARAAIEGEKLGQGSVTDFLAVSLSSTDGAGHTFATNSPRMEDTYLRLDHEFALFFSWLDEKLGKGNYLVFLTADHGGAHNALFMQDRKIPAGLFNGKQITKELNHVLSLKHDGIDGLVLGISNYRVCLNYAVIREKGVDEKVLRSEIVAYMQAVPGVTWALDTEDMASAVIPAQLREQVVNGYYPPRSGAIQLILEPGWYSYTKGGTTHASWNPYDAHIPLVWMGWGIKPGQTVRTTHITDIAPTLAALLKIQAPNGSIGEAIPEVLGERR